MRLQWGGRDGHVKVKGLRPGGLRAAEPMLSAGGHGREGHQQTAKGTAAPGKEEAIP